MKELIEQIITRMTTERITSAKELAEAIAVAVEGKPAEIDLSNCISMQADYGLNAFAANAKKTAVYPREGLAMGLSYTALSLAGEAGEVANEVKKVLRDDAGRVSPNRKAKLIEELGYVLWYVAAVADEIGVSLADVAHANAKKLAERKEAGAVHDNANRDDQAKTIKELERRLLAARQYVTDRETLRFINEVLPPPGSHYED